jgi:hypothetical protein
MSFSNPLLSSIAGNLPNANAGGQTDPSITDEILGPSYDYTATIQAPSQKGVSDDGTIGQVVTNAGAISDYVDDLILRGPLGNQYFKNTGGTCQAPDGSSQNRYSYVNNQKTAADLLEPIGELAPGFSNALQDLGNDFAGIVPGLFGDIMGLNPMNIIHALMLDGSPPCVAYTCPVTDATGTSIGNQTQYVTPALENDLRVCSAAASGTPTTEPFGNRRGGSSSMNKTGFIVACIAAFVLASNL